MIPKPEIEVLTAGSDGIPGKLLGGAVVLVDKPKSWTSFDVVNKIRRLFAVRKAGHAGTLDPIATGLLIVCTGNMTRSVNSFVGMDKRYTGVARLGEITPSYDAETEVSETRIVEGISASLIADAAEKLTGDIEQVPPMYSAVKIGGRRLYRLARKGITVARAPRQVRIHEFTAAIIDLPFISFEILCSKGTYIRTLIHELGALLGPGAHVTELRRTAVGPYRVDEALGMPDLIALGEEERQ